MTWGQMRLLLRREFPLIEDLDALTEYLSSSYNEILAEREWVGIEADLTVSTIALHAAGSIAVTNGSSSVVGTDTEWDTAMSGRKFQVLGSGDWYTIQVSGPTALELDRPYADQTLSGMSYSIFQDVVPLPIGVRQIEHIGCPTAGKPLRKAAGNEFADTDVSKMITGVPMFWIPGPDTAEALGPQVRQIRLWPVPDEVYQLVITYTSAIAGYDGSNNGDTPIAFVSQAAILAGARASCWMHPKYMQPTMAVAQTRIRDSHVAGMRSMDARLRTHTRLEVADYRSREDEDRW